MKTGFKSFNCKSNEMSSGVNFCYSFLFTLSLEKQRKMKKKKGICAFFKRTCANFSGNKVALDPWSGPSGLEPKDPADPSSLEPPALQDPSDPHPDPSSLEPPALQDPSDPDPDPDPSSLEPPALQDPSDPHPDPSSLEPPTLQDPSVLNSELMPVPGPSSLRPTPDTTHEPVSCASLYEMGQRLGIGGFGTVFKGTRTSDGQQVEPLLQFSPHLLLLAPFSKVGRESSTHCNFRKHMQIEKAPANQENTIFSLTSHTLQMLTTLFIHINASFIHSLIQHNQIHNFICSTCDVKLMKLFS